MRCSALLRGEKIVRKPDDDAPRDQTGSAVPSAGGRFRPSDRPHGAAAAVVIAS